MVECYCKSIAILSHSVDVPDPCENWVSTPGPKRITLESRDKIKLPIMYAYCLKTHLTYRKMLVSGVTIDFVRATNFNVRIPHTLCEITTDAKKRMQTQNNIINSKIDENL